MERAAIYALVSANGHTTENQFGGLREVTKRNRLEVVGEHVDHRISGARGADQRPALAKRMEGAVRREMDAILAGRCTV